MLIPSFINVDEINVLLNYAKTIKITPRHCVGDKSYYFMLSECKDLPNIINSIRSKCLRIIGKPCYRENDVQDFFYKVITNGFIGEHTDSRPIHYKHLRFNILLNNDNDFGDLIYDGKVINMQSGDLYIINEKIPHELKINKSKNTQYGLTFGFLIP